MTRSNVWIFAALLICVQVGIQQMFQKHWIGIPFFIAAVVLFKIANKRIG
ncbi:MAG: hypothetical protein HY092_03115 [Candidatus Kerfeldbacteria bacterium]|nr:hypothetical protein [Candidatus Kerfeldbacteria bacterium]